MPSRNGEQGPVGSARQQTDRSTSASAPDLSTENYSASVLAAGLQLEHVSGAEVSGWIELGPEHHTPWGVVHGGVYAAAVETAASVGAAAAVRDQDQIAVGVNNSTDFLHGVVGGRVDVLAVPLQQGRVQQLWLVRILRAEDGVEVVRGQVRLQNVPRPSLPTKRSA